MSLSVTTVRRNHFNIRRRQHPRRYGFSEIRTIFLQVEVAGCTITMSFDKLIPSYVIADDIEENPISDQHQEPIVTMPASKKDILKIGQAPVRQPAAPKDFLNSTRQAFSNFINHQQFNNNNNTQIIAISLYSIADRGLL